MHYILTLESEEQTVYAFPSAFHARASWALRAFLATDLSHSVGWMRGIMDPLVGRAISCMHAAPERRWTLQALAAEVGCSRAVFAQRFSALVGQGALSYLTAWRMHVAAGLLLDGTGNIGT